jgi:hypothetical protein
MSHAGDGRGRSPKTRYEPHPTIGVEDDYMCTMAAVHPSNYVDDDAPSTGKSDETCIAPCVALPAGLLPGAGSGIRARPGSFVPAVQTFPQTIACGRRGGAGQQIGSQNSEQERPMTFRSGQSGNPLARLAQVSRSQAKPAGSGGRPVELRHGVAPPAGHRLAWGCSLAILAVTNKLTSVNRSALHLAGWADRVGRGIPADHRFLRKC